SFDVCRDVHSFPTRRSSDLALFVLFALGFAPFNRADIEFVGILATSHKMQFALADTLADKTDWVSLGETFAEHKLTAYDPATDRSEEHTSELQSLRHLVCRL